MKVHCIPGISNTDRAKPDEYTESTSKGYILREACMMATHGRE